MLHASHATSLVRDFKKPPPDGRAARELTRAAQWLKNLNPKRKLNLPLAGVPALSNQRRASALNASPKSLSSRILQRRAAHFHVRLEAACPS
jgi:hypothetical protein